MKTLAIIPARQGSKGIKHKNLRLLDGKPLLAYSIDAAMASEVSDILLTSDCPDMLALGRESGLSHLRQRPEALASDTASMADAIVDALTWYEASHGQVDNILLLQPTSPLRTSADINGILAQFDPKRESCVAVCPVKEHPYELVNIQGDDWSYVATSNDTVTRRQDYQDSFFFISGALYLTTREFFLQKRKFIADNSQFYQMPRERSVDVDEPLDLAIAEFFLRNHKNAEA